MLVFMSSLTLSASVVFEVPAMRRTIARGQARLAESAKRETEIIKSAAAATAKFGRLCRELTIEVRPQCSPLLLASALALLREQHTHACAG
jgi:hypothetical protein